MFKIPPINKEMNKKYVVDCGMFAKEAGQEAVALKLVVMEQGKFKVMFSEETALMSACVMGKLALQSKVGGSGLVVLQGTHGCRCH